jgi:predicted RNase H-like HicB family nuclease
MMPRRPDATLREEPVKYHVIVHEEDGRYWAEVPALPGCFSMGDSRDEVLANIKEAIACHLDPPTEAKPLQVVVEEVEA